MKLAQRVALSYIRSKFRFLSMISKKRAAAAAFQLFQTPLRRLRKPLPKVFEEAENIQFTLDNNLLNGWRWNTISEKKILIIHGFESSATNFDRYVKPLIRKGYQVLAFDAPAHGRSGGKTITAVTYKEMIKQVHARFGPINAYLAHSLGGLAVCLALEETTHEKDCKLVLIAPATETTTAMRSFFAILRLEPAVQIEFEKLVIRYGGVSSAWYSIRRAMRHIRAQTCWFHDEDDETTPLEDALKIQEDHHDHVRFIITKGFGHRRIYRENKVTREILEFL